MDQDINENIVFLFIVACYCRVLQNKNFYFIGIIRNICIPRSKSARLNSGVGLGLINLIAFPLMCFKFNLI